MTTPTMPADAAEIVRLATLVEALRGESNAVDVLVEVALFEPDSAFIAIRPNDAGTKVILSQAGGSEVTTWAYGWTFNAAARRETARLLRARAAQHDNEVR